MAFNDALLKQGFVPQGATPQVINEPGGSPGFGSVSRIGQALKSLERFQVQEQKKVEKEEAKQKRKFDMFKTLREAGYTSDRAFKAIESGFDKIGPPDTSQQEAEDKADLEKTQASTRKTRAEAKKLERENEGLTVTSKKDLEARILNKIANEQTLTKGEQRVFDETIKRKSPESPFGGLNFGGDENVVTPTGEPGVNVLDPSGRPGVYNKALWNKNKQKLLRKGWRVQ